MQIWWRKPLRSSGLYKKLQFSTLTTTFSPVLLLTIAYFFISNSNPALRYPAMESVRLLILLGKYVPTRIQTENRHAYMSSSLHLRVIA